MKTDNTPFFVGYFKVPKKLRPFLLTAGISIAVFLTAFGLVIGATQDDPGDGALRFDYGRQTITGVIEEFPYPLLHVTEGNANIPAGRTLMMTGAGKDGAMSRVNAFSGQVVTASGILLERGSLDMLQLRGGRRGISAVEDAAPATIPEVEQLGRWKLAGEICDGKCLAGAMRPGRGLAHKACANLCLLGDIPPVFVSTQPIEGSDFLLVVDKDGGILPKAAYDYVAQFISLEADIERRGDLLVMRMDVDTVEVLP